MTPDETYRALQKNPSIVLIDGRDPVEISFVGHPSPMDSNIPLRTATRKFSVEAGRYQMKDNKGFVADVDALMKRPGLTKSDPIIASCRSGPRSAVAARLLQAASDRKVWSQIEGFEGSIDKKPAPVVKMVGAMLDCLGVTRSKLAPNGNPPTKAALERIPTISNAA